MPCLEVRNIVMDFPAVRALDGVSLSFEAGEVHGIIGENGAGKSTLMRILAGLQTPTAGEVIMGFQGLRFKATEELPPPPKGREKTVFKHLRSFPHSLDTPSTDSAPIDPQPVHFRSVRDALKLGIAMIHQELNLVDTLTVAENVFLGRETTRLGSLDRKAMKARTVGFLQEVGATFSPETLVGSLSLAQKQLVEIAKALSVEASILIMDEPTAVLSEQETHRLFELIEKLKAKGVAVIYISHRLPEVERICDRVTVLRDGKLIKTVSRGGATQTELANLMVGRELGEIFPSKSEIEECAPALRVIGLADDSLLREISFEVRPGEIVGLAGLMGSGRTEIGECLAGLRRKTSGSVEICGQTARINGPSVAAKFGLAYVSEDRKDAGLVLSMDVVENTTLANLKAYASPIINKHKEKAATEGWVRDLDIRVGDLRAPVLFLSGGNQQKVALAKWLEVRPKILILDEPTRGVDVGAKGEIYQLIHGLSSEGLACVMISSELPELLGLCHRILVLRHGRIVGELEGTKATEEAIMVLAAGVEAA